jgi:hypothetical protein
MTGIGNREKGIDELPYKRVKRTSDSPFSIPDSPGVLP